MAVEIDFDTIPPEEPLPWLSVEVNPNGVGFCWSRLPQLHGYIGEQSEVRELQDFAAVLENMSDDDMLKLRALLEVSQAESLYEITQLADNLHHHEVDLTLADPEDYACHMLADEYGITKEDLLLDFVDLEDFGAEHARLSGHTITRYGLGGRQKGTAR